VTIIACSLREMAADTLVQLDGHPNYHTTKIFRLEDGSIVGGAGSSPGLDEMLAWLKAGELRGNEPSCGGSDFTILRLRPDGIWIYADSIYPDRVKEKMFAVGCGADIALYAMRHQKMSPAAAAREACKIVPGCGGEVEVLKLPPTRKRRSS
jgi:hypothetical protein